MKITKDTVVQFNYKLTDESGQILESTEGDVPMLYLHGHKQMMKGVEAEMEDKEAGDTFTVTLAAKDAYGERQEGAEQRIPTKHLQGAKKWKKGMVATVQTEEGHRQVTVVKVGKFMITCDLNHPYAGKDVTFDIAIVEVRSATAEELSHGHAHGAGGHQH
jgi:FKBP-type peptidyl-prolyl cis-trans isomerase SlyD